jgi:hypothetical protein
MSIEGTPDRRTREHGLETQKALPLGRAFQSFLFTPPRGAKKTSWCQGLERRWRRRSRRMAASRFRFRWALGFS